MDNDSSESSACMGYQTGEENSFDGMMDDSVNINTTPNNNNHHNHNTNIVDTIPMDFPGVRASRIEPFTVQQTLNLNNNASGMIEWESVDGSLDFLPQISEQSIGMGSSSKRSGRRRRGTDDGSIGGSGGGSGGGGVVRRRETMDETAVEVEEVEEMEEIKEEEVTQEEERSVTTVDLGYEDPDTSNFLHKLNLSNNNNIHYNNNTTDSNHKTLTRENLGYEDLDYEDLGYEDPEVHFQKTQQKLHDSSKFSNNLKEYDNDANDYSDDSSTSDEYDMYPPIKQSHKSSTSSRRQAGSIEHSNSNNSEIGIVRRNSISKVLHIITGSSNVMRSSVESTRSGHSSMDDDSSAEFGYDFFFECIEKYLPTWCSKGIPSCSTMAMFVAQYAPCFWCYNCMNGNLYSQQRRQGGTTEHLVLTRLNILCAMFSSVHIVCALWLIIIMLWPNIVDRRMGGYDLKATDGLEPNMWSINGTMFSIGVLGFVIFFANIVSIRVIHNINLSGFIKYLWVILLAMPIELFLIISLYDNYNVTEVWITHWWETPALAWFRNHFCIEDTSNTKCLVPYSNNIQDEIEWCQTNFNATDCTEIRNGAQENMRYLMRIFYVCNASWGILLLVLLSLIVNTLEKIITRPIVQKSRESNVPAWLLVPMLGCAIVGGVLRYSSSSLFSGRFDTEQNTWVSIAYLCCTAMFLLAAALGWFISGWTVLSSRDKRYKHISLTIFIIIIIINSTILATIFSASLYHSVYLSRHPLSEEKLRGPLACMAGNNAHDCTNCEALDYAIVAVDDTDVVFVVWDGGSTVMDMDSRSVTSDSSDTDGTRLLQVDDPIGVSVENNFTLVTTTTTTTTTTTVATVSSAATTDNRNGTDNNDMSQEEIYYYVGNNRSIFNNHSALPTNNNETESDEVYVVICPEWTMDDVTRVLQTQSKQCATLAGVFFLYTVVALWFGFILRKHLAMYQIEYV